MYRGLISPRKVAVFATNMPRGSAVGNRIGGAAAITDETDSMWSVEHALYLIAWGQGDRKKQEPKRREYPPGALDQQEKEQQALSKAERFMQRHATE